MTLCSAGDGNFKEPQSPKPVKTSNGINFEIEDKNKSASL